MVGLVVTPTTLYSSTSDCRLPLRMRSRERSSSQTATPAFDSCARFSFWAISCPPLGGCSGAPLGGPAVSVQVVGDSGVLRQRSPVGCSSPPTDTPGPAGGPAGGPGARRLSRAAAATASAVSPNSSYNVVYAALAP